MTWILWSHAVTVIILLSSDSIEQLNGGFIPCLITHSLKSIAIHQIIFIQIQSWIAGKAGLTLNSAFGENIDKGLHDFLLERDSICEFRAITRMSIMNNFESHF